MYHFIESRDAHSLFSGIPIPEESQLVVLTLNLALRDKLELKASFIKELQRDLSHRKFLIQSVLDEPTAIDRLLYMLLENGTLRFLRPATEEESQAWKR